MVLLLRHDRMAAAGFACRRPILARVVNFLDFAGLAMYRRNAAIR